MCNTVDAHHGRVASLVAVLVEESNCIGADSKEKALKKGRGALRNQQASRSDDTAKARILRPTNLNGSSEISKRFQSVETGFTKRTLRKKNTEQTIRRSNESKKPIS
jgi:hypothetical protein